MFVRHCDNKRESAQWLSLLADTNLNFCILAKPEVQHQQTQEEKKAVET